MVAQATRGDHEERTDVVSGLDTWQTQGHWAARDDGDERGDRDDWDTRGGRQSPGSEAPLIRFDTPQPGPPAASTSTELVPTSAARTANTAEPTEPTERRRRGESAAARHAHSSRGSGRRLFGRRRARDDEAPPQPSAPHEKRKRTGSTRIAATKASYRRSRGLAVRYGGGRRTFRLLAAGAVAVVALLAFDTATMASKPSRDEVTALVDARMADTSGFPSGPAVMWAGQVVRTWGTWDERNPDVRRIALAPFLSSGMDEKAGWSGQGAQTVVYSSINPQPRVTGPNHAQITAAYQIQDGSWACIALPIYSYTPDGGSSQQAAFALAGDPTPVGCQPRTGTPVSSGDGAPAGTSWATQSDTELTSFFAGFFGAWAGSDTATLAQYTAPGVTVLGLGGSMQATPPPTVADVQLALANGAQVTTGTTYQARMRVTFTVANSTSQISATYQVPVRRDGDRWRITGDPQAVAQSTSGSGQGQPAQIPDPVNGARPTSTLTSGVTASPSTPTTSPTTTSPTARPSSTR